MSFSRNRMNSWQSDWDPGAMKSSKTYLGRLNSKRSTDSKNRKRMLSGTNFNSATIDYDARLRQKYVRTSFLKTSDAHAPRSSATQSRKENFNENSQTKSGSILDIHNDGNQALQSSDKSIPHIVINKNKSSVQDEVSLKSEKKEIQPTDSPLQEDKEENKTEEYAESVESYLKDDLENYTIRNTPELLISEKPELEEKSTGKIRKTPNSLDDINSNISQVEIPYCREDELKGDIDVSSQSAASIQSQNELLKNVYKGYHKLEKSIIEQSELFKA